jgi:hypothetical protein
VFPIRIVIAIVLAGALLQSARRDQPLLSRVGLAAGAALAVVEALAVVFALFEPEPLPPHERVDVDMVDIPTTPRLLTERDALPVDDLARPRPVDERRVVFVGDEITHGRGIGPEQRFSRIVVDRLADEIEGVREINTARPGQSFADEATLYIDTHWRLSPDVVVWVFSPDDLGLDLDDQGRRNRDLATTPATPELSGPSIAYALADRAYRRYTQVTRAERAYRRALSEAHNGRALDGMVAGLRAVRRELDGRGGRLFVVLFPVLHGLEDYPFRAGHETVTEKLQGAGIQVLDLRRVFEGRDPRDLWLDEEDHRPNAMAHRLAAGAISAELLEGDWPTSRVAQCSDGPSWFGEPLERTILRESICAYPDDPNAWLDWAAWWGEHSLERSMPAASTWRYRHHGVASAWVLTPEAERAALEAEVGPLLDRGPAMAPTRSKRASTPEPSDDPPATPDGDDIETTPTASDVAER